MQIIDSNSVGWAMHSVTKLTHAGMQTQAIFGVLKALRDIHTSFPGERVLMLWDGHARHRFAMHPGYKGEREERRAADPVATADHAAYKKQLPIIQKAAELLGVAQLHSPHHEADDLAGWVIKTKGPHRLITGDSDYLQLVSESVSWFDPRKGGKYIDHKNFHQATGYATPAEFLEGKALQGDTSDSIPGFMGIADKTAAKHMARWGSMAKFYEAVDNGTYTPAKRKSKDATSPHPEQVMASPEGRELFARNMRLMDLRTPHADIEAHAVLNRGTPDFIKVRTLFERLGFVSLLKDFDTWVRPFALAASGSHARAA